MYCDVAKCHCANSVLVGCTIDVILDLFIMTLFRFVDQHCEWKVAVVVMIEFIDCVNFVDDVAWTLSSILRLLRPLVPALSSLARCSKMAP